MQREKRKKSFAVHGKKVNGWGQKWNGKVQTVTRYLLRVPWSSDVVFAVYVPMSFFDALHFGKQVENWNLLPCKDGNWFLVVLHFPHLLSSETIEKACCFFSSSSSWWRERWYSEGQHYFYFVAASQQRQRDRERYWKTVSQRIRPSTTYVRILASQAG